MYHTITTRIHVSYSYHYDIIPLYISSQVTRTTTHKIKQHAQVFVRHHTPKFKIKINSPFLIVQDKRGRFSKAAFTSSSSSGDFRFLDLEELAVLQFSCLPLEAMTLR